VGKSGAKRTYKGALETEKQIDFKKNTKANKRQKKMYIK
jgi:hypothetical protein